MLSRSPILTAGLAGGLLFFLHAAVPESRAWPLLWPLLAGVAAIWLAMRSRAEPLRPGETARLGAGAGLIAGMIFYALTIPLLYVLSVSEPLARVFGVAGVISAPGTAALVTLAAVGLAGGLLCGVIGAGIGYPMARQHTT